MADSTKEISKVEGKAVMEISNTGIWKSPMWIDRMELLINSELMSDVTFVVNGKQFYAHKFVLSFASEVFYAMFYGPLADAGKEVEIVDCENPEDFLEFLSLIYKKSANVTWENVKQLSYLRKKYLVIETEPFSSFVKSTINTESCLKTLDISLELEEDAMVEECLRIIQRDVTVLIKTQQFLELKQPALKVILEQDILNIKEIDLFFAVDKWCSYQVELQKASGIVATKREALGDALYHIRFPLLELKDFTMHCRPSKVLKNKEVVEVYDTLVLGPDRTDSKEETGEKVDDSCVSEKLSTNFISKPRLKGNVTVCILDVDRFSCNSLLRKAGDSTIILNICVSKDVWFKGMNTTGLCAKSFTINNETCTLKVVGLQPKVAALENPFFMKALTTYVITFNSPFGHQLCGSSPQTHKWNDFECTIRNCGSGTVSIFSHLIFSLFDNETMCTADASLPHMEALPSGTAMQPGMVSGSRPTCDCD